VSTDGIGFYKFISAICNNYTANADVINDSLDLLYKKLHRKKMYLFLCMNEKYHDDVVKNFDDFLGNIIKNKMKHIYTERDDNRLFDNIKMIEEFVHFDDCDKKYKNEAILTPNDINFCAVSGQFPKELFSGKLSVLRTLFNYEYLWTNIRVLGGAYGCMSVFSKVGDYSLCSYRDPHVSNTNKVYLGIPKFLKEFNKSDEEIEKYVIGSMGQYDNPLSIVDNYKRNILAYFDGITDEEYNKRRHEVLDINLDEIRGLSEIFKDIDKGEKCALISNSKLEEAKNEYDTVWQLIE
jgi:Zn-dependent M16 (insulinase) family peptidase